MKKEIKYRVIDKHTLELIEKADTGDTINLLNVTQIDTTSIEKAIESQRDQVYIHRITQEKEAWRHLTEAQIKQKELEISNRYQKLLSEKDRDILNKDNDLKNKENTLRSMYELELLKVKNELSRLQDQIKVQKEQDTQKLDLEVSKVTLEKNQVIRELEEKLKYSEDNYQKLQRERQSMNVKVIGEDLEIWAQRQYESYKIAGFENTSFEKTNIAIEGEKPDYIFTAYAKNTTKPVVKVICEMKSESILAGKKLKNSDHYLKLDQDRKRHGGEDAYALLVSELEKENDNIIERVSGYDRMYMVRPAYFIPFLSLIYSLSMKYEAIVLENIAFETKEQILKDFEEMKQDILEKTFKNLQNHADQVVDKVGKIKKICDDIELEHIDQMQKNLQTIARKIERFSIKKIIKEIEKL